MQKDGMAMVSPLSPILCNVFMTRLEEEAITTSIFRPDLWLRYINNTFVLRNQGKENVKEFYFA